MAIYGMLSALPFGKYKGHEVKWIVENDPGWLCWLRQEQKKEAKNSFAKDVHDALDKEIDQHKSLRKFQKWNAPDINALLDGRIRQEEIREAASAAGLEVRDMAYAGQWGAW